MNLERKTNLKEKEVKARKHNKNKNMKAKWKTVDKIKMVKPRVAG